MNMYQQGSKEIHTLCIMGKIRHNYSIIIYVTEHSDVRTLCIMGKIRHNYSIIIYVMENSEG